MKRNVLKLMVVIVIIMWFSVSYMMPCSYAEKATVSADGQKGKAVTHINTNEYEPTKEGGTRATEIGNKVIGILQQMGSIISVITLVAIGIKYMMGSVEEKAEYKKTMMPYFIGAILVFATTNILAIISNIF